MVTKQETEELGRIFTMETIFTEDMELFKVVKIRTVGGELQENLMTSEKFSASKFRKVYVDFYFVFLIFPILLSEMLK